MHELSIALSLVELATEEAAKLDSGSRVTALHLKVGALSGVVREALLFGYECATQETPLQGTTLVIEDVPVVAYCPVCDAERAVDTSQWFICPVCGTPTPDIRQGKELQLTALEVEQ